MEQIEKIKVLNEAHTHTKTPKVKSGDQSMNSIVSEEKPVTKEVISFPK